MTGSSAGDVLLSFVVLVVVFVSVVDAVVEAVVLSVVETVVLSVVEEVEGSVVEAVLSVTTDVVVCVVLLFSSVGFCAVLSVSPADSTALTEAVVGTGC